MDAEAHPHGYDVWTHTEVVPKPAPTRWRWTIGPVTAKTTDPTPGPPGQPPTGNEDLTMQLTADQQVALTITGEDRYGNPVDITGNVVWRSSDETIVAVVAATNDSATAVAVGPAGTAAVTVTNDVDNDGTGDFMGSLAIDVVAGTMAEIAVTAGTPTDKPTAP
jgi:hypothetical protein